MVFKAKTMMLFYFIDIINKIKKHHKGKLFSVLVTDKCQIPYYWLN